MKIENVLAVIVAVVAPCLAAPGQTNTPDQSAPPVQAPSPNYPGVPPALATPGIAPVQTEPMPPPLPPGRSVSYAPLVGPDTISSNAPTTDEVVDVVAFDGVPLTDAIQTLALQGGLNIIFDPNLLVAPDGHPLPTPPVTQKWRKITAMQALRTLLENWGWQRIGSFMYSTGISAFSSNKTSYPIFMSRTDFISK